MMRWLILLGVLFNVVAKAQTDACLQRQFMLDCCERYLWRKWYSDEELKVEALFYDLNGDGYDEVLVAHPDNCDKGTCGWSFYSLEPGWHRPKQKVGDKYLQCSSSDFFELSLSDVSKSLVAIDVDVQIRTGGASDSMTNGTFILGMTSDRKLEIGSCPCGVAAMISSPTFLSLETIKTRTYRGHSMVLDADKNNVQIGLDGEVIKRQGQGKLSWSIDKQLMDDGKTGKRSGMVKSKAETKEVCFKDVSKDAIVIFHDEDNDGDLDAFVASGSKSLPNGKFIWRLYRNENGKYVKTERTVIAGKTDFCLVITYTRDPQLVILGTPGGSQKEIRNIILDRYFHRIERLPCRRLTIEGGE